MIGISADSTCDLSPALLEQYHIGITPLHIQIGDRSYLDGTEITPRQLLQLAEESSVHPSTAAVSVGEYIEFFSSRKAVYSAQIHFTISSSMSACWQNAVLAAQEVGGVWVIDSRSLSSGIGHLVLDGAELAAAGLEAEEIVATLEARRSKLDVSFVLQTLDYLRRGGRCSAVAALGANLLQIKPCIRVRDGSMGVGSKYHGKPETVLTRYIRDQLSEPDTIDPRRIFITNALLDPALRELAEETVRSCMDFRELLHTEAGCTVTNHCGPGCFGILFFRR